MGAVSSRERLLSELLAARRAVRDGKDDPAALLQTRARIDAAKRALGERGPAWWDDGAPDCNRRLAAGTPYAAWFASPGEPESGSAQA